MKNTMPEAAVLPRQPLSFGDIYDLYRRKKDSPVFRGMDMPTFARTLNEASGTDLFSAGIHDSPLKRASLAFDELLAQTGVPQATGSVFGSIAREVAPRFETQATKIGESLPRSALEFGGLALAGLGTPAAVAVGVPLAGLGMVSAGAKTYTETDSPIAGLISAATVPLMIPAGGLGAKTAASLLTKRLAASGATVAAKALEAGGAALGQSALAELAGQASSAAAGTGFYNPFSAENMFQHLANQLAFAPLTALHVLKPGPSLGQAMNDAARAAADTASARAEAARQKFMAQAAEPLKGKTPQAEPRSFGLFGGSELGTPPPRPAEQPGPVFAGGGAPTKPQTGFAGEGTLFGWAMDREKTFMGSPAFEPVPDVRVPRVGEPRAPLKTYTPPTLLPRQISFEEPMRRIRSISFEDEAAPTAAEPAVRKQRIAVMDSDGKVYTSDTIRTHAELIDSIDPSGKKMWGAAGFINEKGQFESSSQLFHQGPEPGMDALITAYNNNRRALLIAKGTAIVESGAATKSPEGTAEAGLTANKLAGEAVVNDKIVNEKIEAHIEAGKTPVEAVKAVQQSVENKLNEEVAKPEAPTGEQRAAARLAALPDEVKNKLGERIVAASQAVAHHANADVRTAALMQAAMNWYDKNPGADLTKPETITSLDKSLNVATQNADLAHIVGEAKGGIEHGMPDVEVALKTAPEGTTPFMKEAVETEQKSMMQRFIDSLQSFVHGEKITPEQAKAAGLTKTDQVHLDRLAAVVQDIALGGEFRSAGGRTKKGFLFTPSQKTIDLFGIKESSIQDFVKKNLGDIRKLIESRIAQGGDKVANALPGSAELTLREVKVFFEDKPLAEGVAGSLPAAVRNLMEVYFRSAGHNPTEAAKFADIFMRVAASFKYTDTLRVGELLSHFQNAYGTYTTGPFGRYATVALNLLQSIPGTTAVKNFFKSAILGHELWHNVWYSAPEGSPRQILIARLHEMADTLDIPVRQGLLRAAFGVLIPAREGRAAQAAIEDFVVSSARSAEEFVATYAGLVSLGAGLKSGAQARSFRELIEFSPKQQADFANGLYVDISEMVGAMADLAKLSGVSRSAAVEVFTDMNLTIREFLKSREEIQRATDHLSYMMENMPDAWSYLIDRGSAGRMRVKAWEPGGPISGLVPREEAVLANALFGFGEAKKGTDLEKYLGKLPNWFQKFVMIPAHLRELYTELRDISKLVFDFRGEASNATTRAMAPFARINKVGHVVFDKTDPLIVVRGNKVLEEAASEVFLEQNEAKRKFTEDDMSKLDRFPLLNKTDRGIIVKLVDQVSQAMNLMLDSIKEFQKKAIGDTLASTLIHIGKMRSKDAMTRGGALSEALMAFAQVKDDPMKVAEAEAAMGVFKSLTVGMDPKTVDSVSRAFWDLYPTYVSKVSMMESQRGWYTPEARLGKFYIRWRVNGEERAHFIGVEDKAALNERLAKLEADPNVTKGSVKAYDKYSHEKDVNTLYSDIISVFGDLEKKAYMRAIEEVRIVNPDAADMMEKLFHPTEAVFREVMVRGFGKHFAHRTLAPGREEINMAQGIVAYIEGVSLGMSKSLTKRRASLLLADQDLVQNPELRHLARDYVITVVDPPGKEWSRVKNAAFHYYLGSNFSSLVIESFQPLFSLVPELVRQGTGVVGAYKAMGEAGKVLFNLNANKDAGVPAEWKVSEALQRAEREQKIGLGVFQELESEGLDANTAIANLRRASFKSEDSLNPWDMTKKSLYWWMHTTQSLYRGRTAFNDRIAFLSAYLDGMKRGMTTEEAFNYGVRVKEASMFSGGAAARPIGLFANTGKLYGAVGALYSLRHYSTSMISNFYRMIHDSLPSSGLPKDQVSAARSALTHMVATQMVLSGTLGLPFASSLVSIAEQLFPNLEFKKKVRETLTGLTGDDAEMGEVLSDLALKGITTAFTPLDLSARFGLGDAFGIDPNKGFSAATVFGVPGSLFERAVKGIQSAAAGDPTEAARQALPNAFSTIIKLYHDDFKLRDKAGNLLYDPSGAEVLLAATGFRPKALAKAREEQAMMTRTDEIAKRKLTEFHDEAAKVLLAGHPEQVRRMLLERAQSDETYSVYAGVRAIADSALDQSYPKEFGATGLRSGMASREAIAGLYPSLPKGPSETQRVLERAQLERTLGVAGVGQVARSELRDAAIVDFLRKQNPALSRQHALLMLERLRGGEARRTSSISQLY